MPNRLQSLDSWLLWKEHTQGRSINTVDKYRGYILRWFSWLDKQGSKVDFLKADREQLEQFSGIEAHKQGLSPRSRRTLVAALRGFYTWLEKNNHIKNNPACSLEYPVAGSALPVAASLETAQKLLMAPDLNTFKGVRDSAILYMLIGGGLRLSGLCKLNESRLHWITEEDDKQRLLVRVTEKGNRDRYVPMPAETRLMMQAYLSHAELDEIDRRLPNGDKVVFVSTNNRKVAEHEYHGEKRRIGPRSVQAMIERYGQRCGVPSSELHPHAFRHLYGTELAEGDEDILVRQALLGHKDPKTTEIYTKLASRKLAQAVDRSGPMSKLRTPAADLIREVKGL